MSETPTQPAPVLATRGSTALPLNSLIASAKRLTRASLSTRAGSRAMGWQDDAWEMFDLVGEQRFLAVTLAGRMSQARFFVGKLTGDGTDAPEPVDDPSLNAVLDSIGANSTARSQLVARLGVNLFIAGDGWLCGIPRHLIPASLLVGGSLTIPQEPVFAEPSPAAAAGTLSIEDLEWRMLSVTEVSASTGGGEVQIKLGETEAEWLRVNPDDVFLIRVWRPHPRRWWEADSPTRSSLPVLRELVGLTMHVSSQVDSRLAGAGVLLIPQSAQRALQIAAGLTEQDGQDVFTEALMEAMLTPIQDRANASALVPLCVTVPDESIEKFKHLSFDRPLDTSALQLRDEAIRRLALGEDAPPELLLGTGSMNHWGAWLVLEDVVTTHLEPPLALICDALTTQYLWPVLADQGMTPQEAHGYVIWYDVSGLVVRPTRGQDAQELHKAGVISDEALRTALGFDETDAPLVDAVQPVEVTMALDLIGKAPALVSNPGLPQLVAQIRAVLNGEIPQVLDPSAAVRSAEEKTVGQVPPAADDQNQPAPIGKPGSPAAVPASGPAPASPPPPGNNGQVAAVANPSRQRYAGGLLPGLIVAVGRA